MFVEQTIYSKLWIKCCWRRQSHATRSLDVPGSGNV